MRDLKKEYFEFFKEKGHVLIDSASIIPENDPTCLFITAGMQPLKVYLMGEVHPLGKRLVDVQKCFRTNDLDAVGDTYHHTFFEMLGNWSLGDYFKKESISYSLEFLTKRLSIPLERLAVTVFKGNDLVPMDEESASIWKNEGISEDRIAYLEEEDNWWPNMEMVGPCGPDTEIFYFRSDDEIPKVFDPSDKRWVEIWNNVFMQYNHTEDGNFVLLNNKNVDTGMGVERTTAILEGVTDNYMSSIFKDIIIKIEELSNLSYEDLEYQKSMRIIADHIRAVVMISGDNTLIKPSNTDQGYILRRLIRRMIRHARKLSIDIKSDFDIVIAQMFIDKYKNVYSELEKNKDEIISTLRNEKEKFSRTLESGLREFRNILKKMNSNVLDKESAFKLYDTFGFPLELTIELATEKGIEVDVNGFYEKYAEHQEKSRSGAKEKFKGGMASTGEIEVKYHTTTHLLNAALKEVLGNHIHQKGSNITVERMRFDFSHDNKLTLEQLKMIEDKVNEYIKMEIPVEKLEMSKEEAIAMGAEAMFTSKYNDVVSVYKIGNVSLEICGGPHVDNTGVLGEFHIVKEEASSAGVRRIKAILK